MKPSDRLPPTTTFPHSFRPSSGRRDVSVGPGDKHGWMSGRHDLISASPPFCLLYRGRRRHSEVSGRKSASPVYKAGANPAQVPFSPLAICSQRWLADHPSTSRSARILFCGETRRTFFAPTILIIHSNGGEKALCLLVATMTQVETD